jgi:hypothetical protein
LFSESLYYKQSVRSKRTLFGEVVAFSEQYLGFTRPNQFGFFGRKHLKTWRLNIANKLLIGFEYGFHLFDFS